MRTNATDPARRRALPYRLLLVLIVGAVLALILAAFNLTAPLSPRAVLLLFAGVLLLLAAVVEVVFRDLNRANR
jgi:uncharacterized membrane protein HdeD (DUF308 family)